MRYAMKARLTLALLALAVVTASSANPAAAEVETAKPGSGRGAAAVLATGDDHTCVLLADGSVKCWGYNGGGKLGLGDSDNRGDAANEMGANLPAVSLGTGLTARAVVAGTDHSCALLVAGTVKCWGSGSSGRLGQGDLANRGDGPDEMGNNLPPIDLGTGRTALSLAADYDHMCAILDNGSVKCWGYNGQGQLGLGDTANRGDNPNEMGDDLPAVELGTGRTATALALNDSVTCVLLDNGTVKCWGQNSGGYLGLGDTANRGDEPGEMGDNLPAVDLGAGRTAVAISASGNTACALLDNATVKCWGRNDLGQLGQGDTVVRGDDPGEMGDNLPPIDLGTARTATGLAGGGLHMCALLDDSSVKCWGQNDVGQLGQGDTVVRGDDPGEMGDNLPPIDLGTARTAISISVGRRHSCALLDNHAVKCWGGNLLGQLGQGDTTVRGDGPDEMGDLLTPVVVDATRSIVPVVSPPAPPTGVTIFGVTTFGVTTRTVSWVAPSDDGGAPVSAYRIETSTDGGTTWSVATITAAADASAKLVGLPTGPTRARVSAINIAGTSPPSDPTAAIPPCPTTPTGFTDVPSSSFATADIACIKGLGITTGTTPTTYDPADNVTHKQMAAFLARLWRRLGNPCPTTPTGFTDVPSSSFATADIACIKGLGITTGTTPTTYDPAGNVTREQMAAFLARLWRSLS